MHRRYSAVRKRGQVERAFMARHGENRQAGLIREVISAVPTGFRHGDDRGNAFQMVCRIHRRHGNQAFSVVELHVERCLDVDAGDFSARTGARHCGNGFQRKG